MNNIPKFNLDKNQLKSSKVNVLSKSSLKTFVNKSNLSSKKQSMSLEKAEKEVFLPKSKKESKFDSNHTNLNTINQEELELNEQREKTKFNINIVNKIEKDIRMIKFKLSSLLKIKDFNRIKNRDLKLFDPLGKPIIILSEKFIVPKNKRSERKIDFKCYNNNNKALEFTEKINNVDDKLIESNKEVENVLTLYNFDKEHLMFKKKIEEEEKSIAHTALNCLTNHKSSTIVNSNLKEKASKIISMKAIEKNLLVLQSLNINIYSGKKNNKNQEEKSFLESLTNLINPSVTKVKKKFSILNTFKISEENKNENGSVKKVGFSFKKAIDKMKNRKRNNDNEDIELPQILNSNFLSTNKTNVDNSKEYDSNSNSFTNNSSLSNINNNTNNFNNQSNVNLDKTQQMSIENNKNQNNSLVYITNQNFYNNFSTLKTNSNTSYVNNLKDYNNITENSLNNKNNSSFFNKTNFTQTSKSSLQVQNVTKSNAYSFNNKEDINFNKSSLNVKNSKLLSSSNTKLNKLNKISFTNNYELEMLKYEEQQSKEEQDELVNKLTDLVKEKQLVHELEILETMHEELIKKERSYSESLNYHNNRINEFTFEIESMQQIIKRGNINDKEANKNKNFDDNIKKKGVFREYEAQLNESIKIIKRELVLSKYLKESYNIDYNKNKSKLEEIDKQIEVVKHELQIHYNEVLYEGRDTRSQGLVWVIIAMWKLGCDILLSKLPNFLDEQLIRYLFYRAHKEIEYKNCEDLQSYIKSEVKKYRGTEYRRIKSEKLIKFNRKTVSYLFRKMSLISYLKRNTKRNFSATHFCRKKH